PDQVHRRQDGHRARHFQEARDALGHQVLRTQEESQRQGHRRHQHAVAHQEPERDPPLRPGDSRVGRTQWLPPATTLLSLNMGRYLALTTPPTIPPRTTIITGSMTLVRFSTAWSTSAS